MSATTFDRDALAEWYAQRHYRTDPGVRDVYHVPAQAPEREIRLIEVNDLIAELADDPVQPIDFGVAVGDENEHTLLVVDVTPGQWQRLARGDLRLPPGWSLAGAHRISATGPEPGDAP